MLSIIQTKNEASKSDKKIDFNRSIDYLEILYIIIFVVSIAYKCLYFQFDTKLNPKPIFKTEINKFMILSSIATTISIIAFISLIFYKYRKSALFITNVLITVLILADVIYFRYYYSATSVSLVYQIGFVGFIGDSIKNLLKVTDIVLIADLPIMLTALIFMNKHSKDAQKPIRFSVRIIFSLLMVVIGLFTINAVYARSDTDIYNYDNNHVIKQMGLLYYHYHDAREFIRDNYLENRVLSAEEKSQVEDYYKDKPEKSGDKYRGIAEGKNLIIVQIEALQQFVINKKTEEGNEITPNLNKLVKESLYFDNTYFQISSGNTSDAEFVANNSLYPLKEGSIYFRYPGNVFYSLPKTLKEKGYNTYAFHANNSSFWNRAIMYKSSGFDTFISNRDYILDEYVGWGLGDNSFYRQSLKVIDKTKPFYGFFVTLSSHYPYNFEYFENYEFNTGKYENTLLGDYLKAINYADMALGNFIDQLKESDLYDNTLLVIYGDHSAITKNHSEQLMEFIGKENSELEWIKLQKVPLIIHYPGVENGQINSIISGEIDIFPTIANLMNLNAPFTMGKDLLNSDISEGYAVLRNGSVITDKYIYLSGIMEAFDPDTENELMPEQYEQNLEKYQYELQISDIINQKDALRIIGK